MISNGIVRLEFVALSGLAAQGSAMRTTSYLGEANEPVQNLFTVSLLLFLQVAVGCQQASPPAKVSPECPANKTDPFSTGQKHIEMPVRDIAVEMQQHCTAASKGFQEVKAKIDTALAHGDADEAHYKIKKLAPELKTVQEDMEKCRGMAHGIYEKTVGTEPPK